MFRLLFTLITALALGCVDGRSLRRGLIGERDPSPPDSGPLDATPDRAPPIPDARPMSDAGLPDQGPDPRCTPEICNDIDDDCDGSVDEAVADCCMPGTRRECGMNVGICTAGEQFCTVDLVWSACTGDPPGPEVCDGAVDEDCDGMVDEALVNDCGTCGAVPIEDCNALDDDCDGVVDEGVLNACGDCRPVSRERCNGLDDDCDGQVDEQLLNACGECGEAPIEACNGQDDDCDGQIDEGTLNACGECGEVPVEVCDGRDDDCDGQIDEGLVNACGGCGPLVEACDGEDQDCDGRTDEGACYAFVLDSADGVWRAPPRLNASPLVTERRISAIFATIRGGERLWAVVGRSIWAYDIAADRWLDLQLRNAIDLPAIDSASAVPAWWRSRETATRFAGLTFSDGSRYRTYEFDAMQLDLRADRDGDLDESWEMDRNAPDDFPLTATLIDLHDAEDYWPGDANEICDGGPAGPVGGVVIEGRLFTHDAASCHLFMDTRPLSTWRGFDRAGAPPTDRLVAWDHVSRPDGSGMHIVILDQPDPRGR